MQFSIAAAAALLVAGASAMSYSNQTYVTEVVTAYTTYCPAATQIVHGSVTYTVTEATTLTITNCPCTITYPVATAVATYCPTCSAAPVYTNATVPVVAPYTSVAPVASTAPTAPAQPFTGAANKAFAASGAGLAGLLGLAAYIL